MTFFLLYLFVMLESIATLFASGASFVLLLVVIGTFACACHGVIQENLDALRKAKRWIISGLILTCLLFSISHLLPSPKQAAVIIGGGTVYNVVTSEDGKRVAGKIGEKLEAELDKLLNRGE